MIRAHYTGRLASNGAVFDSSYPRSRPLQFKIGVGQVIQVSWRGRLRPRVKRRIGPHPAARADLASSQSVPMRKGDTE